MTAAAADGGSHAAPPVRLQRDMGDHPGDHPDQTRLWAVPSVQMACRRHAITQQLSAGPQNGPNGRCKCGPAEGRACAYPVFLEIRCQVLGARSADLASSGTLRPHDGRGQGPRGLPPWIFWLRGYGVTNLQAYTSCYSGNQLLCPGQKPGGEGKVRWS